MMDWPLLYVLIPKWENACPIIPKIETERQTISHSR